MTVNTAQAAAAPAPREQTMAEMLDTQFPQKDGNVLHGLVYVALFSLPVWAAIGLFGYGVSRLFS